MVVAVDATRPGLELSTFPGEVNVIMADAVIVTKVRQADRKAVEKVVRNVKSVNSRARISKADMEVEAENPALISDKRVVVVEDYPTVTHGGAPYGAGYVVAKRHNAVVVDPRPYATGFLKRVYEEYPHIGPVLPSAGYTQGQLKDLESTLNSAEVDVIVNASPINIASILRLNKPVVNVVWNLKVVEGPTIPKLVDEFLAKSKR